MKEKINEEINNKNTKQEKFTSFEDFKNAVLTLPQEFQHPFLRNHGQLKIKRPSEITLLNFGTTGSENMELPNDEEIIEEAENESSLSRIASTEAAFRELYKITNGVIYDFTTAMGYSAEHQLKSFHDEIFYLWKDRGIENPIEVKSFCAEKIKEQEKKLPELEKEITLAEEKKQEILDKTKIMGPKKREAYLKSRAVELDYLETKIKGAASMITYIKGEFKKLKINIQKELLAKKMMNARMPYISGKEYFEAYLDTITKTLRYNKEFKNKIEDILLEWALKYQDYPPIKKQNTEIKPEEESKNQTLKLNPLQKKLLDELWRVYPIVEQNPNETNLQHSSLIFQNLLRILEK